MLQEIKRKSLAGIEYIKYKFLSPEQPKGLNRKEVRRIKALERRQESDGKRIRSIIQNRKEKEIRLENGAKKALFRATKKASKKAN